MYDKIPSNLKLSLDSSQKQVKSETEMTNFEDDGKTDGVNVFDFKVLDPDVQELINSAVEVRKRAYCPYSGKI